MSFILLNIFLYKRFSFYLIFLHGRQIFILCEGKVDKKSVYIRGTEDKSVEYNNKGLIRNSVNNNGISSRKIHRWS